MNTTFAPFAVDLYKPSHGKMYHEDSKLIFSNMTPRNDKYLKRNSIPSEKGVVVIGIERAVQFILDLWQPFFDMEKEKAIEKYSKTMKRVVGSAVAQEQMSELHDLGYLPITVRSQKEGVVSPIGIPVFTIHNELPEFFWLTNYLETVLSAETWKTMTVATIAREYWELGNHYANMTCDNNLHLPYQFHDFSMRGMSCLEDAAKSGIGHLAFFDGTDSLPAIQTVEDYYDAEVGASVPATEHSVATSNIAFGVEQAKENMQGQSHGVSEDDLRFHYEKLFIEKFVTKIVPQGIRSYVSDSYDFWRIISQGMKDLKEVILNQDGKLVLRPDSGTSPEEVICGLNIPKLPFELDINGMSDDIEKDSDNYDFLVNVAEDNDPINTNLWHEFDFIVEDSKGNFFKILASNSVYEIILDWEKVELTYEQKGAIQTLWEVFGGTINDKGYKVLDEHIGLIYGDSITLERAEEIFKRLEKKGFASSNIVLGIGSYTYNFLTRDSLGFAVKATGTVIGDKSIQVSKEPKTDLGKRSAKGFLAVERNKEGTLELIQGLNNITDINYPENTLEVICCQGLMTRKTKFEEIRKTAQQ